MKLYDFPKFAAALLTVALLTGLSATAFADDSVRNCVAANAERLAHLNVPPTTWMDQDPTRDTILIDFDDDIPNDEIIAQGKTWGLDLRLNSAYSDDANLFIADVPEGYVPAYAKCLKDAEGIEALEEDLLYKTFGEVPNDPLYPFQWNFEQINVEKAWETSTGKGVVVAVIDTGVALEDDPDRNIVAVKDLRETDIVMGYDFVDDDDFAWDGHGHGTHVAGTIAQSTNNGYGVAGIAHQASIMPLRVLNNDGYGSMGDIADAIRFAADNGAHVINMSLGGPLPSLVMSRVIKYAHKKGVTIVAAAGNSGKREASYPAAYKHVIAVAATQFDRKTTFYSQWGDFVDIAAPGGNTRVDQNGDGRPDGVMQETLQRGNTSKHEFALYMGTSMASPHVAGVAALIVSQGVTNPDAVEKILKETASTKEAEHYSPKEYAERYGSGIVQADRAAEKAATTPGSWRFGFASLLSLLFFFGLKGRFEDEKTPFSRPAFAITLLLTSSGFFFLAPLFSYLLPAGLIESSLVSVAGQPLQNWSRVLTTSLQQNPLTFSFLLPLLGVLFFGVKRRSQAIFGAMALGLAAYSFADALLLTTDIAWIPGTGLLDRLYLIVNGIFSLAIAFVILRIKEK